ncbi:hypothetical protein SCG7109_AD_00360 [Chlamydiales bacterium SCGC AG-110-M15]|nr:hypothetical protein SCG7109_AD_00360 [Chlamydiales bacterium SCGC AG-110-M15]
MKPTWLLKDTFLPGVCIPLSSGLFSQPRRGAKHELETLTVTLWSNRFSQASLTIFGFPLIKL